MISLYRIEEVTLPAGHGGFCTSLAIEVCRPTYAEEALSSVIGETNALHNMSRESHIMSVNRAISPHLC